MESVFVIDNATFDIGDITGAYESYTAGWAKIIDLDDGNFESVDQIEYFGVVLTSDSSLACIDSDKEGSDIISGFETYDMTTNWMLFAEKNLTPYSYASISSYSSELTTLTQNYLKV